METVHRLIVRTPAMSFPVRERKKRGSGSERKVLGSDVEAPAISSSVKNRGNDTERKVLFGSDVEAPAISSSVKKRKKRGNGTERKVLFGSDGEVHVISSSVKKRKKRGNDALGKIVVGSKVEVRQFEDGLRGSWHIGVVIGYEKSNWIIEYTHLLSEDGSSKLVETISLSPIVEGLSVGGDAKYYRGHIRPSPPNSSVRESGLCYGFCIDAFFDDAWWEGVIFDHKEGLEDRLVFFPDQGDQHKINIDNLRITQDWDEVSGDWSHRGNWFFLELLEKTVLEDLLPVSVRQIWYDVRTNAGFSHGIFEWTCGAKSLWSKLVFEAIQENINAALGLMCPVTDFMTEEFTVPKIERGSKIWKSDFSASGVSCEKTEVCSLQRLSEGIHHDKEPDLGFPSELKAAAIEPALDFRSANGFVRHQTLSGFLLACRNNEFAQPCSRVRLEAKRLLLAAGWVFRGARYERRRMHYDSPSGKRFFSFAKACKAWQEEQETGAVQDTMNDHVSKSEKIHSDGDVPANINPSSMENDSHKAWKTKGKNKNKAWKIKGSWQPWGKEFLSKVEYSPEAVKDYCAFYSGEKKPASEIAGKLFKRRALFKAKMHLLALGWKIEYKEYDFRVRNRYTPPNGKPHRQLIKACMYLMQQEERVWSSRDDHETVETCHPKPPYVSQGPCRHSGRIKKMNLMEEQCNCDFDSSVANQDSRNHVMQKAEELQSFRKDRGIVEKIHSRLADLSEGPLTRSRWIRKIKLGEVQSRCALDSFSAKQDLVIHGMSTHVSVPSNKMMLVTDGGSISGVQPTDLSEGPLTRSRWMEKIKISEEQSSFALDSFSAKQCSMNNEMSTDVSMSFNKVTPVTDGGCASLYDVRQAFLPEVLEEQRGNEGNCSPFCSENLMIHLTQRNACRTVIKYNKCGSKKRKDERCGSKKRRKHGNVRNVLSWLLYNGAVLPKQKVYYMNNEDHHVVAEGIITQKGIKCKCCEQVYGLTSFSAHVGGTNNKPAANIFLKDGKSLLQCQTQLACTKKIKGLRPDRHVRMKCNYSRCKSDSICSVCHYGGELMLCDHCPSSFHFSCIGLKGVPEGRWSCPSCQCGICGQSEYNGNTKQFTAETILYCDQCERQYHVGCLRKTGLTTIESCPQGNWFCSKSCSQIFLHLQKLLGKSKPTGIEGLSWTILRSRRESHDVDTEAITENCSKLWVAVSVLHECFMPFIEPRTRKDFFTSVVFNRGSKLNRLNFLGFYTIFLEREDEVISVATIRIHGDKVAEVPLIGTRVQYRRLGMCRLLMNEIEKVLSNLGVERLLVSAVPELVETWINSFGFAKMTSSSKLKFSHFTFLDFQDATMCEKLLLKYTTTRTLESRENKAQDGSCRSDQGMDHCRFDSMSEVIEPTLPSVDAQSYLLHGEAGSCEELQIYPSLGTNYCNGPVVHIQEAGQIEQGEMVQPMPVNVGEIDGSTIRRFIEMAPLVVMLIGCSLNLALMMDEGNKSRRRRE